MTIPEEIAPLHHDHVFLGSRHDVNARRTLWVVGLTTVMMVGEIIAGSIFNSMALLADGFHMATHAGALTIAAVAYRFARRNARNRRFTFGTGKVGDVAGFASALLLALIAIGIAAESITRLFDPRPVAYTEATLVAVLGLIVNVVSAVLLADGHHHDDAHHHGGRSGGGHRHHRDNNLRSAYVHVLADALTSLLAIAALLGGRFLGWIWLDPVMGIVGGVLIGVWSWTLLRDTSAVLLDMSDPHLEEKVRREVEGPGDTHVTDLHIWRLGPDAHAAIVSVTGLVDTEAVRARLATVHSFAHITVETRQPERAGQVSASPRQASPRQASP